ncbi:Uncharacterised protein, partial [Mycoplasmopsis synoviae]
MKIEALFFDKSTTINSAKLVAPKKTSKNKVSIHESEATTSAFPSESKITPTCKNAPSGIWLLLKYFHQPLAKSSW